MPVDIREKSVRVPYAGRDFEVYEARPESAGSAPAVLVVHEWWGLNAHIRDVTRRLAGEGFRAMAPDLYEGRLTQDAGEAAQMMTALDPLKAVGKMSSVIDSTGGAPAIGAGVMGFCMGGSLTLALATRDERIRAVVPFYGQVPGDDVLTGLKAPVLYFAAGQDDWITRAETERLAAYLERTGLGGEVVRYEDADHAFFNDTRESVYRADFAADAWKRAVSFLRRHLAERGSQGVS